MKLSKALIFPVFVISAIAATLVIIASLTTFSEQINMAVFHRKAIISEKDKIWLVQKLGLWLALYLFGLACAVMVLRITTGKSNPASGNDSVIINTINRIITNTIQQSVIFAGLFGVILFSDVNHVSSIGQSRTLALASLFVLGRVAFAIGYLLAAITRISTMRGFGFAIGLGTNIVIVSFLLGVDSFGMLEKYGQPLLKSILASLK